MTKYIIECNETVYYDVRVEADSLEEAYKLDLSRDDLEFIITDYDNFEIMNIDEVEEE